MNIVENRVSELLQVSTTVGKPKSLVSAPIDNELSLNKSMSSNEDERVYDFPDEMIATSPPHIIE
jgi:hypothetical protein